MSQPLRSVTMRHSRGQLSGGTQNFWVGMGDIPGLIVGKGVTTHCQRQWGFLVWVFILHTYLGRAGGWQKFIRGWPAAWV